MMIIFSVVHEGKKSLKQFSMRKKTLKNGHFLPQLQKLQLLKVSSFFMPLQLTYFSTFLINSQF